MNSSRIVNLFNKVKKPIAMIGVTFLGCGFLTGGLFGIKTFDQIYDQFEKSDYYEEDSNDVEFTRKYLKFIYIGTSTLYGPKLLFDMISPISVEVSVEGNKSSKYIDQIK